MDSVLIWPEISNFAFFFDFGQNSATYGKKMAKNGKIFKKFYTHENCSNLAGDLEFHIFSRFRPKFGLPQPKNDKNLKNLKKNLYP